MKRSKRLCLLLGVLVIASLATAGVLRMEDKKEKIKTSGEIILALSADSVQSLSWEYQSESLAFHREDGSWVYDGDAAFPVSGEKMDELLSVFEQFGVSFIIESVEDDSQYGLDRPVCTIQIGTGEQSYEICLGDYSTMDSERYVSIGDGNVYLAKVDPLDSFDAALRDVIDHDEVPDFDTAEKIAFAGKENYAVTRDEDSGDSYCAEDVYFTRRDGEVSPLDTSRVNSYLKAIRNLDLTDYVTYNATAEELEQYGLSSPELTVTVEYISEEEQGTETLDTFALSLSRDPKELAAAEAAAEKEAEDDSEESEEETVTAYARIGESPIIYRVSGENYKRLMAASFDDLRHPQVFTGDFADVQAMDISLDGEVYQITTEKKGEEHIYYYQEREIDASEFQNAVNNLKAVSFTGEQPTQKEEIGVTIYLNHERYPEVSIKLYRYNGTECLAVIDGKTVSLVDRADVVDLIEAVYGIVLE